MKLEFKPEDFHFFAKDGGTVLMSFEDKACLQANARLAEMLKDAPTVYFGPEAEEEWAWTEETEITNPDWLKDATRKAKLVEIDRIK